MTSDPTLTPFSALVGTWTTEATHPMMPGVIVHGTATVKWLEGERFLDFHALTDHPDFPDTLSIIGDMSHDQSELGGGPLVAQPSALRMYSFDSRGVFRIHETSIDATSWRVWRMAPGFSQRFAGRFSDGGTTISGTWGLCTDDITWADDLAITYRREQ